MDAVAIGVQQSSVQSRIGIEAVKNTLDTQKAIANLVEETAVNVPISPSLGTKLDITV